MTTANIDELKFDAQGLIPAVVQEAEWGTVLMVAYMNRESLRLTLETGETHFWSRSRQELWRKGATSGHVQKVVSMSADCDSDALLVKVVQEGVACHTGDYSCFHDPLRIKNAEFLILNSLSDTLGGLTRTIHQRNIDRPEGSYTTKLFEGGVDRILKKIGEESGEIIIAAKNHDKKEIAWEVSDFLYHLLVLMEAEGVSASAIAKELGGRMK